MWVITGDGDALSIGGNHLIHALRRNVNIKILLFNNRIYGLTKGQYSPTSEQGKVTKSTPFGSLDTPFNPVSLALGAEASFVARTIDSDRKHLTSVLRAAADHKGAAFVEIYQNCPIFNDDAFAPLKEPESREQRLIRLEDGELIRFGPDHTRGLRFGRYGALEPVDVTEGLDEGSLIVHNAHAADPVVRVRAVPAGQLGLRAHPDRGVPAGATGVLRRAHGGPDRRRPGPARRRRPRRAAGRARHLAGRLTAVGSGLTCSPPSAALPRPARSADPEGHSIAGGRPGPRWPGTPECGAARRRAQPGPANRPLRRPSCVVVGPPRHKKVSRRKGQSAAAGRGMIRYRWGSVRPGAA